MSLTNGRPVWTGGRTTFEKNSMPQTAGAHTLACLDLAGLGQVWLSAEPGRQEGTRGQRPAAAEQHTSSGMSPGHRRHFSASPICPFNPSCQLGVAASPCQVNKRRSLTKRTGPPPRFPRQVSSSTRRVSPLICMAIISVDPPDSSLVTLVGRLGHRNREYPLSVLCVSSVPQVSQQVSQFGKAAQRVLVLLGPLPPAPSGPQVLTSF